MTFSRLHGFYLTEYVLCLSGELSCHKFTLTYYIAVKRERERERMLGEESLIKVHTDKGERERTEGRKVIIFLELRKNK